MKLILYKIVDTVTFPHEQKCVKGFDENGNVQMGLGSDARLFTEKDAKEVLKNNNHLIVLPVGYWEM